MMDSRQNSESPLMCMRMLGHWRRSCSTMRSNSLARPAEALRSEGPSRAHTSYSPQEKRVRRKETVMPAIPTEESSFLVTLHHNIGYSEVEPHFAWPPAIRLHQQLIECLGARDDALVATAGCFPTTASLAWAFFERKKRNHEYDRADIRGRQSSEHHLGTGSHRQELISPSVMMCNGISPPSR